ncbi:MAG: methyl-accepting chemotaxis protein [Syntrophomonadaceae bacterium]
MVKLTADFIKTLGVLAPVLMPTYEQGAIFLVTDLEKITYKYTSDKFDVAIWKVGSTIEKNGMADTCIQKNAPVSIEYVRSKYGIRLQAQVHPLYDSISSELIVGTFSIVYPSEPVVARAFPELAPMLAEMFPEGAFIYMTGRHRVSHRQASNKFDMPDVQVEVPIQEGTVSAEVLKYRKPISRELNDSHYGVPALVMAYPLAEPDKDGLPQITGTFGLALPKTNAATLRKIADTLKRALEEIAKVVQDIAIAAGNVAANYQQVDANVAAVFDLSENINEVIGFIKQIADETKMLGLNAAIEAARAGESGRGFGVVAEEIRKLSDESRQTVGKIRELTNSIGEKLTETSTLSAASMSSGEEQAAATEQLTASIQEILALAQQLDAISKLV